MVMLHIPGVVAWYGGQIREPQYWIGHSIDHIGMPLCKSMSDALRQRDSTGECLVRDQMCCQWLVLDGILNCFHGEANKLNLKLKLLRRSSGCGDCMNLQIEEFKDK